MGCSFRQMESLTRMGWGWGQFPGAEFEDIPEEWHYLTLGLGIQTNFSGTLWEAIHIFLCDWKTLLCK